MSTLSFLSTPSQPRGAAAPLFGAPAPGSAPATGLFGAPAAAPAFSFGTTTTTTPAAPGAAAPAATTPASPFSFGTTTTTTPGAAATTPASPFSFGTTTTPAAGAAPAANPFALPATPAPGAASAAGTSIFGLPAAAAANPLLAQQQQAQQQQALQQQQQKFMQTKVGELPDDWKKLICEVMLTELRRNQEAAHELEAAARRAHDENARLAQEVAGVQSRLVVLAERTRLEVKQVGDMKRELAVQLEDGHDAEMAARKYSETLGAAGAAAAGAAATALDCVTPYMLRFLERYVREAREHVAQLERTMKMLQRSADSLRAARPPTVAELSSSAKAVYDLYVTVSRQVAALQQDVCTFLPSLVSFAQTHVFVCWIRCTCAQFKSAEKILLQ